MEVNHIFNEDVRLTLNDPEVHYDYVITSPPDLDEVDLKTSSTGTHEYRAMLDAVFRKIDKRVIVTIINRDRKSAGTVLPKAAWIAEIMQHYDWQLKSHKIWVRSYKANLYRFNYSHIQTFRCFKGKYSDQALPDAFHHEVEKVDGYVDNFPVDLVKQFIEVYCPPDGIVFDPFMGTASTALAAIQTGRKYVGSEINRATYEIGMQRLQREKGNLF